MTEPLRVLHVVAGLPGEGHPWLQPFIASQIASLRQAGVEIQVFDLRAIYGNGFTKYIKGMLGVWRRLRSQRYDLVHAHYSYCGWAGWPQQRVPLVVSLMGSDLFGGFDLQGRRTLRGEIDRRATQALTGLADHIIVKSNSLARLVPRRARVSVVPNGVDFSLFKPGDRLSARRHFGLDDRQKVILFAADPSDPRKNYSLAEKSVSLLTAQLGERCLLWPFYKREQSQLPVAMNAADALLMTSLAEGSPNVVKEAMACNLPIVSARVGDVPEVVAGTHNCYLTGYDPGEIASSLAQLLKSGARSNGRECIPHLTLEAVAAQILKVYRQVTDPTMKYAP